MTAHLTQTQRALAQVFMALLIAVFGGTCLPNHAHAVQPDEILKDPALEARAREISLGLRCLVCQNQSIDDSDAPLARDLRLLVRERLKAGDNNAEVVDFIVARYGDFVLLKPPLNSHTMLLWLAPLMLLLGAIVLARRTMTYSNAPGGALAERTRLSPEEKVRLDEILSDTNSDSSTDNVRDSATTSADK